MSSIQTKQPKTQSSTKALPSQSATTARKQIGLTSSTKLNAVQPSRKSPKNNTEDSGQKSKEIPSLYAGSLSLNQKVITCMSAQKNRNKDIPIFSTQVTESQPKPKIAKYPYKNVVDSKLSRKKGSSALSQSAFEREAFSSLTIIPTDKQSSSPSASLSQRESASAQPTKRSTAPIVEPLVSLNCKHILRKQHTDMPANETADMDSVILVTESHDQDQLPNFKRLKKNSLNLTDFAPNQQLIESNWFEGPTEKQTPVLSNFDQQRVGAIATIQSRYAIRRPFIQSQTDQTSFPKSLINQQPEQDLNDDSIEESKKVSELSSSIDHISLKSENEVIMPQIEHISTVIKQPGIEQAEEIEINQNQVHSGKMKDQSINLSPRVMATKRPTTNNGLKPQPPVVASAQFMTHLLAKAAGGSLGTNNSQSEATTILASESSSIHGQMPQQISLVPKHITHKTSLNAHNYGQRANPSPIASNEGVNVAAAKPGYAHSPTLRRPEPVHQTLLQHHTQGRKVLSSGGKNVSQPIQAALANRVQVSPINKNISLARDGMDINTPLTSSCSNASLQKPKAIAMQAKTSSIVTGASAPKTVIQEQSFTPTTTGTMQQKKPVQKNTVDLTPSNIGNSVKEIRPSIQEQPTKSASEVLINKGSLQSHAAYQTLLTVIEQSASMPNDLTPHSSAPGSLHEAILNVALNEPNQNVIQADCQRTRFLTPQAKQQMVHILTYFVKQEKITYKQGINEILLPFIWLEIKDQPLKIIKANSTLPKQQTASQEGSNLNVDLERVYLHLKGFIDRYLPNIFINDEFLALQSCMTLMRLLFRYHAPRLYRHLEEHQITVEMYAIPWILTYFSTKMDSPELVLQLWNKIADQPAQHDFSYIFFFAVALLVENEEKILESDLASLPVVMASLRIKELPELQKLFWTAQQLQGNTPFSFNQLPELQQLSVKTDHETLTCIWKSLELLNTIPLLPAELFFYCFPGECDCANPTCSNSLTYKRAGKCGYLPPESTSICSNVFSPAKSRFSDPFFGKNDEDTGRTAMIPQLTSESFKMFKQTSFGISQLRGSPMKANSRFDSRLARGQSQLETESNLNCEFDRQESPIDMINETTRMKHLNADDFKNSREGMFENAFQIQIIEEKPYTPDYEDEQTNRVRIPLETEVMLNLAVVDREAEQCSICKQRSKTLKQIDTKALTSQADESFEDLSSSDCLINQIRFIAIDCRHNALREEGTLPHSLNFNLTTNTRLDQLKKQVEQLSMYKETHHICLIGLCPPQLPQAEDVQATPKRRMSRRRKTDRNKKLTIKDFHEDVLTILVELFVSQGFMHISTLPGGFQQVHDLAMTYGFQLEGHRAAEYDQTTRVQPTSKVISPKGVEKSSKRCYHCQHTVVQQEPSSALIMIRNATDPTPNSRPTKQLSAQANMGNLVDDFNLDDEGDAHEVAYYFGDADTSLMTQNSNSSSSDEADIDLLDGNQAKELAEEAGGWDYIPFGLRQVYEAASHINRMFNDRNKPQTMAYKVPDVKNTLKVEPISSENQRIKKMLSSQEIQQPNQLSANRQREQLSPERTIKQHAISTDKTKPKNNDTVQPFIGQLSGDKLTQPQAKISSEVRNPQYQNQQHLQQQTQYKLISKVADIQSSSTLHQTPTTFETTSSPMKKVRSRKTDLQPQEMQYNVVVPRHTVASQRQVDRNIGSLTINGKGNDKDKSQSSDYGSKPERQTTGAKSIQSQGGTVFNESNFPMSASRHETSQNDGCSENPGQQDHLPIKPPREESYLLNGIVKQIDLDQATYDRLTSNTKDSQVSYVFTAVRLPARKKNFQIVNQSSFNHCMPSKILITPFTVVVLHKESDVREILPSRLQTEEIDSNDFEESDQSSLQHKAMKQLNVNLVGRQPQDTQSTAGPEEKPYAVLQSRFFMYDLIKITSRKSTTKIITFYFRIPLIQDYPADELEAPEILQKLNSKPPTKYAFAFKRKEFEDVSMSFEFEFEEQAKMCIAKVSNLYKELKDKNTRKRSPKKSGQAVTDSSEALRHLQIKPVDCRDPQSPLTPPIPKSAGEKPQQKGLTTSTNGSNGLPKFTGNNNPQNPNSILSKLSGQQNPTVRQITNNQGQGTQYSTSGQYTTSQNSQHQKL